MDWLHPVMIAALAPLTANLPPYVPTPREFAAASAEDFHMLARWLNQAGRTTDAAFASERANRATLVGNAYRAQDDKMRAALQRIADEGPETEPNADDYEAGDESTGYHEDLRAWELACIAREALK